MTPDQCKSKRINKGWTVKRLSKLTGIAPNTIVCFENGGSTLESTADKIKKALFPKSKTADDKDLSDDKMITVIHEK